MRFYNNIILDTNPITRTKHITGIKRATINIDNEAAKQWLKNGAQPTETVRTLLKKSGAIEA